MSKREKLNPATGHPPATIMSLSHDGRGIAQVAERKAFISGTLPNEIVTYQITRKRRQVIEADLLEIITPSPDRAKPPCQHFGICGGCSLQHMNMQDQLTFKQKTLLDQLKFFGKVIPSEILPPLDAQAKGYRRKARLGVKYVIKKNKLLVGFREKSSNYLADIERCVVLHPLIGERLTDLAELIASLEQFQHIPQIEIAIGDSDAALVFRHLEHLADVDLEKLIAFGKAFNFHIYLQPNSPEIIHKIWPQDHHERLTYSLPKHNLEFLFHPLDFTQINLEINRLMVDQALELLAPNANDTVLDLYCGIGNFTLPLARKVKQVIGVEGSADMVARAMANVSHNKLENASFYAANLESPSEQATWLKPRYTKILLDPPRVGAKEIIPLLSQINVQRIVYISCNPATLARDAGELVNNYKFRLQKVGIMNMFPHTSHVEAMAVFEK